MLDVDHFKRVNDVHGHSAGDLMLRHVAQLLLGNIRQVDLAARYGGEEFVVLLPHTKLADAVVVATRIRDKVRVAALPHEGQQLRVTVSIGLASNDDEQDRSEEELIARADAALYRAKAEGRDRVVQLAAAPH
jgi:diguanylate cyclase (GGDEF)-like protein